MKKRKDTVAEWIEEATSLDGETSIAESVDGSPPTLRNVVLMGQESRFRGGKVRRRYADDVMESLVGMFDGVRVYANHADPGKLDRERPTGDLIGFVANPRRGADSKIRGDLTLIEGLEETTRVLWCAKNKPSLMGFSPHLRDGRKTWKRGGVETIIGVGSVASADIVTEGATTHGLFESAEQEGNEDMDMDYDTLTVEDLQKHCPALLESIRGEGSAQAEIVALKAQVATQETAAAEQKQKARKDLVESLVEKLPATLAETVRALPDTMPEADLKGHVAAITESMGGKPNAAQSSERTTNNAQSSDDGVPDTKTILKDFVL